MDARKPIRLNACEQHRPRSLLISDFGQSRLSLSLERLSLVHLVLRMLAADDFRQGGVCAWSWLTIYPFDGLRRPIVDSIVSFSQKHRLSNFERVNSPCPFSFIADHIIDTHNPYSTLCTSDVHNARSLRVMASNRSS